MEEQYIPTRLQKLFRAILGAVLVSWIGYIFIIVFSGLVFKIKEINDFVGMIFTWSIAFIFAGLPTLVIYLIAEFYPDKKLSTRFIYAGIYALILGVYLEILFSFVELKGLWLIGSIIAVMITEFILYWHIKYCAKKDKFAAFNYAKQQMHKRNRQKQIQETD